MKLKINGQEVEIPAVSSQDAARIEELAREDKQEELQELLKKLGATSYTKHPLK